MVANLMTNTPARDAFNNAVQSIAGRITAGAGGPATLSVQIGTLPAGALILGINTNVETALVGTTPTFNVGTTATGTDIAAGIALTAGTVVTPAAAALANPLTADTQVWANITGTPTAGDAFVTVQFIKPVS
jgi:hypothetical protein